MIGMGLQRVDHKTLRTLSNWSNTDVQVTESTGKLRSLLEIVVLEEDVENPDNRRTINTRNEELTYVSAYQPCQNEPNPHRFNYVTDSISRGDTSNKADLLILIGIAGWS
jgi:hypothetical protein